MARHEHTCSWKIDHPAACIYRASLPDAFVPVTIFSSVFCSRVFLGAALVGVAFLTACAPKPPARALVPDGYAAWGRTTELRLDYPIPGHEDNFRIIYMNETGFGFSRTGADREERVEFPEGTVIAKEVYEGSAPVSGAVPMMVTAMIKASGHPDARGGWVWVAKDLAMGKETIIKGDFCFTCHGNANEAHPYGDKNPYEGFRDYVFFIPGGSSISSGGVSSAATVLPGTGY